MKSLPLGNGVRIPVLGFGTSRLVGGEGTAAIRVALSQGYRHIDTADSYGNHEYVAAAIAESGVPRKEIFLTSKIDAADHAYADMLSSFERYCEELKTDYIDLLLIHWPNRAIPVGETLKAMQELKETGKIRAVGVSNFTKHHLEDALQTGIEIVNNQVETHPTFNQKDLREFCTSKNIIITAYAPLGRGADLGLPLFTELSQKYNVSVAQVILNWALSRGMVTIPKSKNPERIKDNFNALSWQMEEADLVRIDSLPQGKRIFSGGEFDY